MLSRCPSPIASQFLPVLPILPFPSQSLPIRCLATCPSNIASILPRYPSHAPKAHSPSTSRLRSLKKSLNHLRGLSGSSLAKYFIPSSSAGVTFLFSHALVALPVSPFADPIM